MNIYADQLSIVNRYVNYKDNHYVWKFDHMEDYDCLGVYTETEIFHTVIESVNKLVYNCPYIGVTEKADSEYIKNVPAIRTEDVFVGDEENYADSDTSPALKGLSTLCRSNVGNINKITKG